MSLTRRIDPFSRNKASASSTIAGGAAELLESSICEDNGALCRWAVSYTHLTLPTTPYV